MAAWRGILIAFALLAAISSIAQNAQAQGAPSISKIACVITGTQIPIGDCIASAIPLALIGIGISLLMGALAFMAGEIMNYNPLKGFYKRELWETIKSTVIIAIIFSVLVIASSIATAFAGNPGQLAFGSSAGATITSNFGSLYNTALTAYIQPQLQASYVSFAGLLGLSVGTGILRTFSMSLWLPIPIPTPKGIIGAVQFGAETSILQSGYIETLPGESSTSLISLATAAITTVLLVFQFQSDLLYVAAAIGLGVFLPLGIIMRAIPFLRNIGGSMIAIGIGLSIIYPILLVGFNLPISNYMYTLTSAQIGSTSSCPFSIYLLCRMWDGIAAIINSGTGFFTGGIPLGIAFGPGIQNLGQASALSGQGFWTGLLGPFGLLPGSGGGGIFPALNFVIDNSLQQLVQFFLFILDIIIGYSITNGIAHLLGGRIWVGIGKFRLV